MHWRWTSQKRLLAQSLDYCECWGYYPFGIGILWRHGEEKDMKASKLNWQKHGEVTDHLNEAPLSQSPFIQKIESRVPYWWGKILTDNYWTGTNKTGQDNKNKYYYLSNWNSINFPSWKRHTSDSNISKKLSKCAWIVPSRSKIIPSHNIKWIEQFPIPKVMYMDHNFEDESSNLTSESSAVLSYSRDHPT
jgi:hypothetical protein